MTRPVFDRSDFQTTFNLPTGEYDIYVWGDADDGSLSGIHYGTDDFGSITISDGEYTGNTEDKDAFEGMLTVSIPSSDEYEVGVGGIVEMHRPLAAYAFIATDLKEFTESETSRQRSLTAKGCDSGSDDSRGDGSRVDGIDLSDYTVRVRYPVYLPSEYNMFTSHPSDSRQGVSFTGNVSRLNDDEALIGFDHLFVNGTESAVSVALEILDSDGEIVATVPTVNVPTRRGRATIVRGEFLTSSAAGGTAIDPKFDGEFNIPL